MKKYLAAIKISLMQSFAFRADFYFSRFRNLLLIFTIYYLYTAVYSSGYRILNFTGSQMVTYVFISTLIYSYVFVYTDNSVAGSIASGNLNFSLIKPVNYELFEFFKTTGSRLFNIFCSTVELGILFLVFRPNLYIIKYELIPLFLISLFLCSCIFFVFNLYAGSAAFLLQNAYGPRFILRQFLELFTGRYFPLAILPPTLLVFVKNSPLWYIIYQPIEIYFSTKSVSQNSILIIYAFSWLLVLLIIHKNFWHKAIKNYEGYGI